MAFEPLPKKAEYPHSSTVNSNPHNSIALLGTSADPPTTGHKALLIGLSKLFPKVITWASDNPDKEHQTSLVQRYELLRTLVEAIELPNLELRQELSSKWAITTLNLANKLWPKSNLVLIIGSDLVKDLPKWFKAKSILTTANLGIVPRQGWPLKDAELQLIKDMGGKANILPLKVPNTASSRIHSQPTLAQIPKAILPILREKNLYGISQQLK